MTLTRLRSVILVAAIALAPPLAGTARADAASALRCQQTIGKELAKFVKLKSTILKSCKESAVKRGVPPDPVDRPLTTQDDKINAAEQKLQEKITAACGGANRTCNAADAGVDADEPLAAIGWDVGTCPDLRTHGCANAITDCNDVGACVACIGHEAVNQASELSYDLLVPGEFATGSPVNACQIAIGKAMTTFLQAKAKLLQGCWANVLAGKPGFTTPPGCPVTDATTVAKLAQAERKKIAAICKACGAGGDADADGQCDLPSGAFSPTAIGFEPDCPDMVVPSSGTPCSHPVSALADVIACVDCVTEFATDCSAELVAPTLTPYAAECN